VAAPQRRTFRPEHCCFVDWPIAIDQATPVRQHEFAGDLFSILGCPYFWRKSGNPQGRKKAIKTKKLLDTKAI